MTLYDTVIAAYDKKEGWRLVQLASTDDSPVAQMAGILWSILRDYPIPAMPSFAEDGKTLELLNNFMEQWQEGKTELLNQTLKEICDIVDAKQDSPPVVAIEDKGADEVQPVGPSTLQPLTFSDARLKIESWELPTRGMLDFPPATLAAVYSDFLTQIPFSGQVPVDVDNKPVFIDPSVVEPQECTLQHMEIGSSGCPGYTVSSIRRLLKNDSVDTKAEAPAKTWRSSKRYSISQDDFFILRGILAYNARFIARLAVDDAAQDLRAYWKTWKWRGASQGHKRRAFRLYLAEVEKVKQWNASDYVLSPLGVPDRNGDVLSPDVKIEDLSLVTKVIPEEEGGGYCVYCLEFGEFGLQGDGDTAEGALAMFNRELPNFVSQLAKNALRVPKNGSAKKD